MALEREFILSGELVAAVILDQIDDADRLDRRVFENSGQNCTISGRRGIELDDAQRLGQKAQAVRVEQRLALRRQFAEAVDQFLLQSRDVVRGVAVGQALVERQALVHVGAVVVRQQRRQVQVDFGGDRPAAAVRSGILALP